MCSDSNAQRTERTEYQTANESNEQRIERTTHEPNIESTEQRTERGVNPMYVESHGHRIERHNASDAEIHGVGFTIRAKSLRWEIPKVNTMGQRLKFQISNSVMLRAQKFTV